MPIFLTTYLYLYQNTSIRDLFMLLTYIFHSGFAVETEHCVLVFDCWLDPSGVMLHVLKNDKPMYVFASHFHDDHFSPTIFRWREQRENVTYILSKDILRHRRAAHEDADVWLAKGGTWQNNALKVYATGSTDSGVSWVVEVDGKRLFHAGDLGNWYVRFLTDDYMGGEIFSQEFREWVNPEREEKRYLGELKDIAKVATDFDIAFLPVDSRIGNGYTRGARQFLEQFNVKLLVPMHFTLGGFQSAWRMEDFAREQDTCFWNIARNGESRNFE